jgi:hypothetical protein
MSGTRFGRGNKNTTASWLGKYWVCAIIINLDMYKAISAPMSTEFSENPFELGTTLLISRSRK